MPDKHPPVKTVGPLTDEDVIKLRPCEKKQVCLRQSFLKYFFLKVTLNIIQFMTFSSNVSLGPSFSSLDSGGQRSKSLKAQ